MSNVNESNIPSGVQAQLDAVHASLKAEEQSSAPSPAPASPAKEKVEEPIAKAKPDATAQESTPNPAPNADRKVNVQQTEDTQHRLSVTQGMLKAQGAENSKLREEVKRLQEQLEQAKTTPQTPAESPKKAPPSGIWTPDDITNEEIDAHFSARRIEEWGYEDLKEDLARERNLVEQALQNNPHLRGVEESLGQQAEEAFLAALDQNIPGWEQIQDDAGWDDFLKERERLTGLTYNDILADAVSQKDANRAAEVYRKFTSSEKAPSGFDQFITPRPQAPSEMVPGQKMRYEDWQAKMDELPKLGLSASELEKRQTELVNLYQSGRVALAGV